MRKWFISFPASLLHQGKFRLKIRKRFCPQRVAGPWNKLPRKVVVAPSLPELKECLDNTLGHSVLF